MEKSVLIVVIVIVTALQLCEFTIAYAQPQIDTNHISNNAVTSPKIQNGEVKTQDIANNAITSAKISTSAVETTDIADDSVTSDKIKDGSITAADLSPGAIALPEKFTSVSNIIFNSCSIDFPAVSAQGVTFAFCPVPGVKIGDKVIVTNQDLGLDLLTQSASVNASDLVRIAVRNPNFYSADPPQITWAMIIFRT